MKKNQRILTYVICFSILTVSYLLLSNSKTTNAHWSEENTVTFKLGELHYISGNLHGHFIFTGVSGKGFLSKGHGTISYAGSDGSFNLYVHEGDTVYIDILSYKVLTMTNDAITLQRLN